MLCRLWLHYLFLATAGLNISVFVGWSKSLRVYTKQTEICKQILYEVVGSYFFKILSLAVCIFGMLVIGGAA